MTDADAIADELYRLPLDQFTEARNARAKEIGAAGDRPTAAAVRKLPKPSLAAWLANALVRDHRSEIDDLLDLGRALRQAQEQGSGPEMRALSARRQELVHQLIELAAQKARADGHSLGAQPQRKLEATLDAAVADQSAAAELRSGRLTETLHHVGFGDVATLRRGAGQPRNETPRPAATKTGASQAERASGGGRGDTAALTRAKTALADAHDALKSSGAALDQARRGQEAASTRRRDVAKELREAERHLAQASAVLKAAKEKHVRVDQKCKEAEREFRRQSARASKG